MEIEQPKTIQDQKELLEAYLDVESRCIKLDNYEEPGLTVQEMIQKLMIVLQSVKDLQLFSPNETLKQVHTQNLKLLVLPFWLGWLHNRIQQNRMKAVMTQKDFVTSFLQLMDQFSCQEEEVFPSNLKKMWISQSKESSYRPPREQLIQAMKEKKAVEQRYKNWQKIKEESDKRQALKDYITLQIHESITMLRAIEEEIGLLKYKDSIQKDEKAKEEHQKEINKPIPKIKVMKIPPQEEIQQYMCPPKEKTKKELVAQVWQENANKPTISLEEVGQMEIDNAQQRAKRQAKQREENKVDTDSDKEQNDARMKKQARRWDDWKDSHQKGGGNLNQG